MNIPEGFRTVGAPAFVSKRIPAAVERTIRALDALAFGLIASSRQVAALAELEYTSFRKNVMLHPAVAPYRFKPETLGSPIYWGNKQSIEKLIEANAQIETSAQ